MKKGYFSTCEYCGGSLDPGEKCDCRKQKNRNYTAIEGAGYRLVPMRQAGDSNKKTG